MSFNLYLVFLWAFLLTVATEGTAILIILRRKKYVYYSLLCNMLTNPALNLLMLISVRLFGIKVYYPILAVLELAVVFVEAAVYNYICRFGMRKSLRLSAFLNALSLSCGILLDVGFRRYF